MKIWITRQLPDPQRACRAFEHEAGVERSPSPGKDGVSPGGAFAGCFATCFAAWLVTALLLAPAAPASAQNDRITPSAKAAAAQAGNSTPGDPVVDPFFRERKSMIDEQVRRRGIDEPDVLRAMENVPRHLFVDRNYRPEAYSDSPVTIAPGQTMSQAYVSARMIALLDLEGNEKVLEVGTGSGYDAALLSRLAKEVFTIEIDKDLGSKAQKVLEKLEYENVTVKIADGYRGWPEEAPFDAILVTTAPEHIPQPLVDQLKVGGRMVIAVGRLLQDLQVVTKTAADEYMVRKVSLVNLTRMEGEVRQEN